MRSIHTPFLYIVALAAVAAPAITQQKVCLSVHQQQALIPAAGNDVWGHPSRVTACVAGRWIAVYPQPGTSDEDVSAAHELAFQNAGFTTQRVSPTEFCITAAPGGADIVAGAVYEVTDLNLAADSKVHDETISNPVTKSNGVLIALPAPSQPPVAFGGQIDVDLFFEPIGATGPATVSVPVPLPPFQPAAQMVANMRQRLLLAGFRSSTVLVLDPASPSGAVDALQIERTTAGEPVFGIEIHWDAGARQIVRPLTGAGVQPLFGASEYGVATAGTAAGEPWSYVTGTPLVGGTFGIVHETHLPVSIEITALSLVPAPFAVPVFNGNLLVDPSSMLLEIGLTDALGAAARPWLVPPDPMLSGFELASQAVALAPPGNPDTFSTGVRVVIR
ncbi:MAG TPA: hypothetical protein VFZ65_18955 [Planctomycetota bacterium]|nr:hypothetical protein [Planctomycetota bacterium]